MNKEKRAEESAIINAITKITRDLIVAKQANNQSRLHELAKLLERYTNHQKGINAIKYEWTNHYISYAFLQSLVIGDYTGLDALEIKQVKDFMVQFNNPIFYNELEFNNSEICAICGEKGDCVKINIGQEI